MRHEDRVPQLLEAARRARLNRREVVRRAAGIGLGASLAGGFTLARPARGRAQEKTQIRLGVWAAQQESEELQAVLDEINQASTTFEIVQESTVDQYLTKLQTTLAGGTAPDLFWMSQENVAGFADRGALLDITDRIEQDQSPTTAVEDYFPSVLQTAQYDGKTYGLPWISQPIVLYYNPALFEAAGVAPPDDTWTWDTFREAAGALTNPAEGIYGTSFNGWPPIQMFIWQAGGEVISEDLSSCPIDSPEAIAGAQFYADIIYNEEYAVPEAVITEQGFGDMVKAGKVAMFFGGAADDLDYASTKDPSIPVIDVALVPKGPANRTNFSYVASTVINADTDNPDVAFEALVALTEGIHHWKVLAPRQSLANAETITASIPGKAKSAATIIAAAQEMRGLRVIPRQQEWDVTFLEDYQDPLFHDEATAEELAPEVRPELEEFLPN